MPPRLVKWDNDPDMKADISELGVEKLKNKRLDNDNFFQLFNSREYQKLDHSKKMDLMWTQLTKVKKVKCQDFEKLWKNFLQEPNHSFKKVGPSNNRLGPKYLQKKLFKEQEKIGWGDEMGTEETLEIRHTRQKYVH